MAHSCRGVRRNACPFAEELRPLPAGGDIGAASDGRRDCRPHAVGYFDDDPSGSPSRVFTLPMTAWPPSPMRTYSTRTYCSVPCRSRRWTSTCIVKAFSRRVAADPSAAKRRSLPPPPLASQHRHRRRMGASPIEGCVIRLIKRKPQTLIVDTNNSEKVRNNSQ